VNREEELTLPRLGFMWLEGIGIPGGAARTLRLGDPRDKVEALYAQCWAYYTDKTIDLSDDRFVEERYHFTRVPCTDPASGSIYCACVVVRDCKVVALGWHPPKCGAHAQFIDANCQGGRHDTDN